ncbi:MAG TPA: hypothetical protein VF329_00095 [Gammaproteobacteria bacterium]
MDSLPTKQHTRASSKRAHAALGAIAAAFAACAAPPPEPVSTAQRRDVTGTVTAVYPQTRLISVTTDEGRPLTLLVPDEVSDFERIEVGDRITSSYYEAVAAEVTDAPAGGEDPVSTRELGSDGNRPGATRSRTYTGVVTIEAIDSTRNIVRISGPEGFPTEVAVQQPEMRAFVAALKPGDRVMVTYSRAEAITITPAD